MTQQAVGTHAESPSPRLPAIRTLHNPAWVPPPPGSRLLPSTTGAMRPLSTNFPEQSFSETELPAFGVLGKP
jgi:hypothetical protein